MPQEPDAAKTHLPTYHGCFVCGQHHTAGLCTRFYLGTEGRVHALFQPTTNHTGYVNVVHGGIITAFLDELMMWSIGLQTEMLSLTIEMTIKFRKQVFANQTYTGTSYPGVSEGKRFWSGRAELADENGTLVAKSTGRFIALEPEQTRAFGAQMTFAEGDLPIFRAPLVK